MFENVFFHDLHTQIRVIDTLDLMSDATNWSLKSGTSSVSEMMSNYVLSLLALRDSSTNSRGVRPVSRALENIDAASSSAPPKRDPIVSKPDANEEIRSLPARVATMVFMALRENLAREIANRKKPNVPGHCRTVISSQHEHHLNELGCPWR